MAKSWRCSAAWITTNPQFGQVNVTVAPRQPGSSFKPFTYVTAFHKGYTAATMLDDIPTDFDAGPNQPTGLSA